MKHLKLLLLTLVLLLTHSAAAQSKFGGKVIDVLDGKTVVIETVGGRVTAALQYIEVPEREQALNQTVVQHLRQLVMGKTVEFRAQRLSTEVITGQVITGGVDVSQQMLRDGAAWHISRDRTGQDAGEWAQYDENQAQARAEKLGVWSVPGLKPAWEFRAEKEEEQRQRDLAAQPKPVVVEASPIDQTKNPMKRWRPEDVLHATANYKPWPEVMGDNRDASTGIARQYDVATKLGSYETKGAFLNMTGPAGNTVRVETRSLYIYAGSENAATVGAYGMGFAAATKDGVFQNTTPLTLMADGKKISLKPMKLITKKVNGLAYELLLYKLDDGDMQTVAYADKLEVKLGAYTASIDGETINSMRHLMLAKR